MTLLEPTTLQLPCTLASILSIFIPTLADGKNLITNQNLKVIGKQSDKIENKIDKLPIQELVAR